MPRGRPNTVEDFWALVDQSGGPDSCWPFMGRRDQRGYGRFDFERRRWFAHRLAYTLVHGPIPDGLHVCHACDNEPCCRPSHLFVGTASDNERDKSAKGRARPGGHPQVTDDLRQQIIAMHLDDPRLGAVWIARQFNVGETTVREILRDHHATSTQGAITA